MAFAGYRGTTRPGMDWLWPTMNDHLGAEYNSISKSIVSGRGFSDPFQTQSGPTAWMAPILSYLLAVMYWFYDGDIDEVVRLFLILKAMVITFAGTIIISVSRQLGLLWIGYAMFPIGLCANFFQLFQMTHDVELLLLNVCLLWLGLNYYWQPTKAWHYQITWGVFGGFAALCSPAIGMAWAICSLTATVSTLRRINFSAAQRWKIIGSLATLALVSMFVVAPWTIRNRVVMGKWIPIKSNLSFEIWQSQCLDDDGVLDAVTTGQHLWPYDGPERRRYVEVGETEFLKEKWSPVTESILRSPTGWLRRVANRFVCATLYYHSYTAAYERWVWPMRFKRLVYVLPFLSVVAGLILKRRSRAAAQFLNAIQIYVVVLMPYILVSYDDRYVVSLLPIKLLLILYAINALLSPFQYQIANEDNPISTLCKVA